MPIGASLPIPIVFSQTWRMAAPITALSISFIARQAQQSTTLNRVLRTLIEQGLVISKVGKVDKRERHLFLTDEGSRLEQTLSDAQRARMRSAFRDAGPEAVAGFRTVLEAMMDTKMQRAYTRLKESGA